MGIAMPGFREHAPTLRRTPSGSVSRPEISELPAVPVALEASRMGAAERLRRSLNFILALLGLMVALPVMLVVAVLIRLTSRGPVIYTQTRSPESLLGWLIPKLPKQTS